MSYLLLSSHSFYLLMVSIFKDLSSSSSSSCSSSPTLMQPPSIYNNRISTEPRLLAFMKNKYKDMYKTINDSLLFQGNGVVCIRDWKSVRMKGGVVDPSPLFYNVYPKEWYEGVESPDGSSLEGLVKFIFIKVSVFAHLRGTLEDKITFLMEVLVSYPMSRVTDCAFKLDNLIFQMVLVTVAEWRVYAKHKQDVALLKFTSVFSKQCFAFFEMMGWVRMCLHDGTALGTHFNNVHFLNEAFMGGIDSFASLFTDPATQEQEMTTFIEDMISVSDTLKLDLKDVMNNREMFCITRWNMVPKLVGKRLSLVSKGYAIFPVKMFNSDIILSDDHNEGFLAKVYGKFAEAFFDSRKDVITSLDEYDNEYESEDGLFEYAGDAMYRYYQIETEVKMSSVSLMHYSPSGAPARDMLLRFSLAPVDAANMEFKYISPESIITNSYHQSFPPCINSILTTLKRKGDLKYSEKLYMVTFMSLASIPFEVISRLFEIHYHKKDAKDVRRKNIEKMYNRAREQSTTVKKIEYYNCAYPVFHGICPFRDINNTGVVNDIAMFYGFSKPEAEMVMETSRVEKLLNNNRHHSRACVSCSALCSKKNDKDTSVELHPQTMNPVSFFVMRNRKKVEIAYDENSIILSNSLPSISTNVSLSTYASCTSLLHDVDTCPGVIIIPEESEDRLSDDQYDDDDDGSRSSKSRRIGNRYSRKSLSVSLSFLQEKRVKKRTFLPLQSLSWKKNTDEDDHKFAVPVSR